MSVIEMKKYRDTLIAENRKLCLRIKEQKNELAYSEDVCEAQAIIIHYLGNKLMEMQFAELDQEGSKCPKI